MTSRDPYTSRYTVQQNRTTLATSRPAKAATSYSAKAPPSYPTTSTLPSSTKVGLSPSTIDIPPPLPKARLQADDEAEPMYEMTDTGVESYMDMS